MFQNIKSRLTVKKAAVILTFALVITGSGLSSLASLQDTLNDSIAFNTLSVNLQDGSSDSSSISFSSIDPSVAASFEQDIALNNSGSASATVSVNATALTGAGSDLDANITTAIFDGTCASGGPRLPGTVGPWGHIADIAANTSNFALNAGQAKAICVRWAFAANPALTTTSLTERLQFVATHP